MKEGITDDSVFRHGKLRECSWCLRWGRLWEEGVWEGKARSLVADILSLRCLSADQVDVSSRQLDGVSLELTGEVRVGDVRLNCQRTDGI